ncbi:hypothetical protein [Roseivirga sp. E12]|uniref:hypothetical protein n=1 Tax=Roseivirga sp. E12 TaxID=2819237 RepID=UPI001ABD19AF|nr:hypothetical protein [Roseivirga sp. E12]MBO3697864.1 hypothetical protein [Roseivirga sp. E12]
MKFFKRLVVIVTVSLFWHNTHAQFFTGEIKYKTTLTAKNDSFNIEDIDRIATNDEYRYKITSGYYKTSYFKAGAPTYSYTYHGDSKRMYDEQIKDGYISYRDSRRYDVPLLGFQVDRDSTITHLGKECFLVKEKHPNYTS